MKKDGISDAAARKNCLDCWKRVIPYAEEKGVGLVLEHLNSKAHLNPDGTVRDVQLLRSSGEKVLDDAAIRIVRLASPYAPFTSAMREETDILQIIRTWQFLAGNRLSAG
jgi:protein TonB